MKNITDSSPMEDRLRACGFPFELLENRIPLKSARDGADYWGIELGATAPALVDRRLLTHNFVYGGSGDPGRTLKLAPEALLVLNEESRLIDVPCLAEETGKGERACEAG